MTKLITQIIDSPSYIRDILGCDEKVILIYQKKTRLLSTSDNDTKPVVDELNVSLDLTGNPLLMDLSGEDLGNLSFLTKEAKNWTEEENRHYPMTLKDARRNINEMNKTKNKNYDNFYIYCVCDGSDLNHTVIIGAHQSNNLLCRTQIFIKGCFAHNDPLITISSLKQQHLDNVGDVNTQDECLVTGKYILYGFNLRNCLIKNSMQYTGCIFLEMKWNTCEYEIPEYISSVQMNLQVIAGHKESQMYIFWRQLSLLNKYITIFSANFADLDKMMGDGMSDDPREYTEVLNELCAILNKLQGAVRYSLKKKMENIELNTNKLRENTLTDKLWILLTHCNNVGDLKCCFHVLFEELAAATSVRIDISEDNKTGIATIIRDIANGKLAVPTLTSIQALEFLIELGLEKLKMDYFHIIDYFDCLNYEKLSFYWSHITRSSAKTESFAGTRVTKGNMDMITMRKTRMTVQSSASVISIADSLNGFNCLINMHLASEFLLMAKTFCSTTQGMFDSISRSVCANLLNKETSKQLYTKLPDVILHELKVDLRSPDIKFLRKMTPVAWNLRLKSINNRSTVITIFHHTSEPVFPPSIYNNYDVPVDQPVYYVAKSVTYIEDMG